MTLDKAIEILSESDELQYFAPHSDLVNAIKLGIKALKWIKENRGDQPGWVIKLLPGETKD